MKKTLTALLLLAAILASFASCASVTPDVLETQDMLTDLSQVNWSIPVEGASASAYTMAEAQKHDLTKFIVSMLRSSKDGNISFSRISMIMEGCLMKEMIKDMGMEGATATVYVNTLDKGPQTFELTAEEMSSDNILLGWICNKKEVLPDTETYIGIFFNDDYKGAGISCCWLDKIEFHK